MNTVNSFLRSRPLRQNTAGARPVWPDAVRGYGAVLRDTLCSRIGQITLVSVFITHALLYLYLSGMLLYRANMRFNVPISYPFVHIDLNPPSNYQPYILFLPTNDFHLLVNLTGAAATITLSALVALNAALSVRNWRFIGSRGSSGSWVTTTLLPSLIPNLGCCTGMPVILAILPASISGVGIGLGRHYGIVMAGVILMMIGGSWLTMHTFYNATGIKRQCDTPERRLTPRRQA